MAKPEWGTKCLCRTCGARFYDLKRKKVVCPKCSAPYEAEAPARSRRNAPAETAPADVAPDAIDKPDAPVAAKDGGPETFDDDEDNGKGRDIIEDVTELGEDEDDVAEIVDGSRKHDEA